MSTFQEALNLMKFFQRFFVCFFLFCVLVCSVSAQPIVRVSVLRATDQPFVHQHELNAIREDILQIQSFFASEMNRLGYGKKTFEFETNIPVWIGARELSFYQDADDVRWQQGRQLKDFPDDIHLVFVAGAKSFKAGTGDAAGVFTHRCDATGNCDYRRLVAMPLEGNEEYRNRVTAHELGHAFGYLKHLTTQEGYIMEEDLVIILGSGEHSLFNYQLHPDVAKTLNASKDLSINNNVDTSNFDRIYRPDDPETNPSHDALFLPNLVAYYPFDGNADDASGNGNHGQSIGSINYVDGKFGKALELDNGEYIEMESTDTLHGNIFKMESYTLSTWIYPNPETTYGHVWRGYPISGSGHTLFILGDNFVDNFSISWRANINGRWARLSEAKPGIVKANEWIHVAVTNDGDKFRIYANGEVVAETNFHQTDSGYTRYLIGSPFAAQETFAGWIDDSAVFSRALTEGEIKRIIEVGVKQFIDRPVSATDSHNRENVADVNGDGTVDISDVKIVRKGMSAKSTYDTDLNNDGITDEVDLAIVKAAAHAAIAAAAPRKRKVNITTWGRLKRR